MSDIVNKVIFYATMTMKREAKLIKNFTSISSKPIISISNNRENFMIKTKPGGAIRRMGAQLLDLLIILIPVFILHYYFRNPLITLFLQGVYYIYFEQSNWQATPGKKMLNLKVTDINDNRISFIRAAIRFFLYMWITYATQIVVYSKKKAMLDPTSLLYGVLITGLFILQLIWILPILFTKNKTGVYELLSDTRVVYQSKKLRYGKT